MKSVRIGAVALLLAVSGSVLVQTSSAVADEPNGAVSIWKITNKKVSSDGLARIRPRFTYSDTNYDIDKATVTVRRGTKVVRLNVAAATLPRGTYTVVTKVRFRTQQLAVNEVMPYPVQSQPLSVYERTAMGPWRLASRSQTLVVGSKGDITARDALPAIPEYGWLSIPDLVSPRYASKKYGAYITSTSPVSKGNVWETERTFTITKGGVPVADSGDIRLAPGKYKVTTKSTYRHRRPVPQSVQLLQAGTTIEEPGEYSYGLFPSCTIRGNTPATETAGTATLTCHVYLRDSFDDIEGLPTLRRTIVTREGILADYDGDQWTVHLSPDIVVTGPESPYNYPGNGFSLPTYTPTADVSDDFLVYEYGPEHTTTHSQTLVVKPPK